MFPRPMPVNIADGDGACLRRLLLLVPFPDTDPAEQECGVVEDVRLRFGVQGCPPGENCMACMVLLKSV